MLDGSDFFPARIHMSKNRNLENSPEMINLQVPVRGPGWGAFAVKELFNIKYVIKLTN